jgi:2-oxoisovalerate dehydrogenase E1 component
MGDMSLPSDLDPLERELLTRIAALDSSGAAPTTPLDPLVAAELFEAQVQSRIVDHVARWLRNEHGLGYYTIGSAGHESNAAVAMALRPTDPALLHYRSGGFYFSRAAQVPGQDPIGDLLRGMLARSTEPIAGGRHKVFGNHALNIIPQTSTIASHLPRAVGLASSFGHAGEIEPAWPADSVVVCSFGDASLNHSTAQGALNTAALASFKGEPLRLLFVCEDNGLGISVPTPAGWVGSSTTPRSEFMWATADGHDPGSVLQTTARLVDEIRSTGRPGFLHLRCVRFLGHAGTDAEAAYRSPADLRSDLERDPILATAAAQVAGGECRGADLVAWYLDERNATRSRALELCAEPELLTAAEVMEPLAPRHPQRIMAAAMALTGRPIDDAAPATFAQTINRTLGDVLTVRRNTLVFGEDVGRKGGVYGITRGLQKKFGPERVFDTILDEQSILGLALGAALNGFIPIPEIQYLAYLHNAEDQLRGEAASLAYFSQGQYLNPMVVRIAGYGYQKGFGGHFHNDNSIAVLRDIPGLVIASPSHPSDAGPMLRTCVAAAEADGSVCVFLEPIARYHTADLHSDGDGLWLAPPTDEHVPIGAARTHGEGTDGTILTWGNGLFLSLRAQRQLAAQGQSWRVIDLRWLAPLPVDDMLNEAAATGRVLVVDETRRSGGVGEGIIAALVEGGFSGPIARVAAADSFVPLGAAAGLVLVSEQQIIDGVHTLARIEKG